MADFFAILVIMRLKPFLFLAVTTAVSTYLMNAFFLADQLFWSGVYAFFVVRNLYQAYQVTSFIRLLEKTLKK